MKIPDEIVKQVIEHCKLTEQSAIELVSEDKGHSILIIGSNKHSPTKLMLRGAIVTLVSLLEAIESEGENVMEYQEYAKRMMN